MMYQHLNNWVHIRSQGLVYRRIMDCMHYIVVWIVLCWTDTGKSLWETVKSKKLDLYVLLLCNVTRFLWYSYMMCNHPRVVNIEKGLFFSCDQTCFQASFAYSILFLHYSPQISGKATLCCIVIVTFVRRGTKHLQRLMDKGGEWLNVSTKSSWSEWRIKKSHHKTGCLTSRLGFSSVCYNGLKVHLLYSCLHSSTPMLRHPISACPSKPCLFPAAILFIPCFLMLSLCLVNKHSFSSTQRTPMDRE